MNININDYELVSLKRKDKIYRGDDGTEIPYKDYYVEFKRKDNPLVFRAKVDKVFRAYVEMEDESTDGEEIAVRFDSGDM